MFLTLTCDSYGRVRDDGTPVDPASVRLPAGRAGRAALRRAGRPVHPEPAPRPRLRRAVLRRRRTAKTARPAHPPGHPRRVPRAVLRQVIAATYHQVWWPSTDVVRFDGDELPVWDEDNGTYLDPATGEVLPTWDQALDAIGPNDDAVARGPVRDRVRRPGRAGRVQGRRPVHPLPDQVPDQARRRLPPGRHRRPARARRPARRRAAVRAVLADLRQLAPLRHPAQERPRRPAPRRVQGQGPPPRAPRLRRAPRAGLPQVVGQDARRSPGRPQGLAAGTPSAWSAARPGRYTWHVVTPSDHDHLPYDRRLLHVVADRTRWKAALDEAKRRAQEAAELSASGRAA